ncbi:adenine-specific DNA methylase, contains a Zn-ribbon domain [Bacteroidales bacterium 6E]|nr:adenine-specific DNA methylase, contains a Zn-ribbon domain [Bacteroidales bacterium 6E]
MKYPKRLIEVDLPIKRISAHARREKSIRHGHISTLHIWWARRPLAACRAVLCASLWPDPADPLCSKEFIEFAQKEMIKWSDNDNLPLLSKESIEHFIKVNHDKKHVENKTFLRTLLLDFIADFSNWDNSFNPKFLQTSRDLTYSAHIAHGGQTGTKPLVVDPFAGGGSIPLEGLRVGAESFASDLNPLPVLINKVQLEYIPKYGRQLADEVLKWGQWVKEQSEKELNKFYPSLKNPTEELYTPKPIDIIKKGNQHWGIVKISKEIPIAYLWARTVKCEGPSCGAEVPLIRSSYLAKKGNKSIGLKAFPNLKTKRLEFEIIEGIKPNETFGTVQRGNAICKCCGYVTPVANVRKQLIELEGGADSSRLLCVVTTLVTERKFNKEINEFNEIGRYYRIPDVSDIQALRHSEEKLNSLLELDPNIIPNEVLPLMSGVFNVPLYGINQWRKLFTKRQLLSLVTLIEKTKEINSGNLNNVIRTLMAFAIDRQVDYNSSICTWVQSGEFIGHTLAQGQSLPIKTDFAEVALLNSGSGNYEGAFNWIASVIENLSKQNLDSSGTSVQCSASEHILADDSSDVSFTDPPYYNAVPYSDLSDFFYVWLKRSLSDIEPKLLGNLNSPKEKEICEMAGWDSVRYSHKDSVWYEHEMGLAMSELRRITKPSGISIVVFAHKSTSGWEAQLQAMLNAGWIFTASWPIDTEMATRLRAHGSAALASSVHLVCRPRENEDGSLIQNQIGDWRDVQEELPKRIHEWMPRLAAEGVAGADAIFACLGPALEIFSRYTKVVQAGSEREISLREYLEKVWAAVSQEALNMVFSGGEAQGLEEDARLTAMWLWTLTAGESVNGANDNDEDSYEDDSSGGNKLTGGFILEYDTARKVAQGLGANLEDLKTLVEVKGDKARLLPVIERTNSLFGSASIQQQPVRRKNKEVQLSLFTANAKPEEELKFEMPDLKMENTGKTVLDRLHQAMLLFSTGRTEALKRFLVEDGAGKDDRFWKLAQSLTSLYPKETDERRWVEAVQTYKKSLGF